MSDKPLNHLARLDTRLHQTRSGEGHSLPDDTAAAMPPPQPGPSSQSEPYGTSEPEPPTIDALLKGSDWEARLADARARRAEVLAARAQTAEQHVAEPDPEAAPIVPESTVAEPAETAVAEIHDAASAQMARLKTEAPGEVASRPPPRWGLVVFILALCVGAFVAVEFYL
ncbi:hypothetical protein G5B39_13565 (plasmid) [Rhodobacteraceae bacterium SC52]|nr:hypothetical protein G5B39_13565 [Rhodobacteraceae bacterium SC52]